MLRKRTISCLACAVLIAHVLLGPRMAVASDTIGEIKARIARQLTTVCSFAPMSNFFASVAPSNLIDGLRLGIYWARASSNLERYTDYVMEANGFRESAVKACTIAQLFADSGDALRAVHYLDRSSVYLYLFNCFRTAANECLNGSMQQAATQIAAAAKVLTTSSRAVGRLVKITGGSPLIGAGVSALDMLMTDLEARIDASCGVQAEKVKDGVADRLVDVISAPGVKIAAEFAGLGDVFGVGKEVLRLGLHLETLFNTQDMSMSSELRTQIELVLSAHGTEDVEATRVILDSALDSLIVAKIITRPPSTPSPLMPGLAAEPGSVIDSLSPVLRWQPVSGADFYSVAVSEFPYGEANVVWAVSPVSTNEVRVAGLRPGTKYRWNISASNIGGSSGWSYRLYFETPAPPTESKIVAVAIDDSVTLANDSSVSAEDADWVISVTNASLKPSISAGDIELSGIPEGLLPVITRTGSGHMRITLSGSALTTVSHEQRAGLVVRSSAAGPGAFLDSDPVELTVSPAAPPLRVVAQATDATVCLGPGNTVPSPADDYWVIKIYSGRVKPGTADSDIRVTGLPEGLSTRVSRYGEDTVKVQVTGTSASPLGARATVQIGVKASALMDLFGVNADSMPVEVHILTQSTAAVRPEMVLPGALHLAQGTGISHNIQIRDMTGSPPFSWSSNGLPPGISLSPNGLLSGSCSNTGTWDVCVQVIDAASLQDTRQVTFTVGPKSLDIDPGLWPGIVPGGIVGQSYRHALQATGGTGSYIWSLSSGTLPPGIALLPSGILAGTPTAPGQYTFNVRLDDSSGKDGFDKALTMDVAARRRPQVTSPGYSTPWGPRLSTWSSQVTWTGAQEADAVRVIVAQASFPFSTIYRSELLPPTTTAFDIPSGAFMRASSVAVFVEALYDIASGPSVVRSEPSYYQGPVTPEPPSPVPLGVGQASAPGPVVSDDLITLRCAPSPDAMQYVFELLDGSGANAGYSAKWTPFPFATFPAPQPVSGLTQTWSWRVTARNEGGETTSSRMYFRTPDPAVSGPSIAPSAFLPMRKSESVDAQLSARDGSFTGPWTWTLAGEGIPGMALSSSGRLSGTPTTPGTYRFTVLASAPPRTVSQDYEVRVFDAPLEIATREVVARAGEVFDVQLDAMGGSAGPRQWYIDYSSCRPFGTTLLPSGQLSGIIDTPGVYRLFVSVVDSTGTAREKVWLNIAGNSPKSRIPVTVVDRTVALGEDSMNVDPADSSWLVTVPYQEVNDTVSAKDVLVTGLPEGLAVEATKVGPMEIALRVTGKADSAISTDLTPSIVIRSSALVDPGFADSLGRDVTLTGKPGIEIVSLDARLTAPAGCTAGLFWAVSGPTSKISQYRIRLNAGMGWQDLGVVGRDTATIPCPIPDIPGETVQLAVQALDARGAVICEAQRTFDVADPHPSLLITAPSPGSALTTGNVTEVTWNATGYTGQVVSYVVKLNTQNRSVLLGARPVMVRSMVCEVPAIDSSAAQISLQALDASGTVLAEHIIPVTLDSTPGDLDGDGAASLVDMASLLCRYGMRQDHPDWDANHDLAADGVIDLRDVVKMARLVGR